MVCEACGIEFIKCIVCQKKIKAHLVDGFHVGTCTEHGITRELIPCQPNQIARKGGPDEND